MRTESARRRALYEQTGSVEQARAAFRQWQQQLRTIDPLPPYHPRCVHALERSYTLLSDARALWVGDR